MSVVELVRRALWNDAERRPRAPWRFVLAAVLAVPALVVALLAALGAAALVPAPTLRAVFAPTSPDLVPVLLAAVAQNAALAGTALVAAYFVDRRYLRDLGLGLDRGWILGCAFGLALSGSLMTGVFAVELLAGWTRVTGTVASRGIPVGALALYVAAFVAAGVGEEVVFRGYVLTNVAEGLSGVGPVGPRGATAVGVGVTSLVFGLGHLGNPGATAASAMVITLAGVVLGTAYVLTGRLAVPVGFHAGWNLFQGVVFGFPVSGLGDPPSLVAVRDTGPEFLTGGRFGPEAGLIGGIALALAIVALLARARATGTVGIHPGITTPDLRWLDRGSEGTERRSRETSEGTERRSRETSEGTERRSRETSDETE